MRKFFLNLALLLSALIVGSLNVWGDEYVKVTSTAGITDGTYLIVYEVGNVAFNGGLETLDATSNTITVDISGSKIASTSTTDAAAFTLDVTNGTIFSASGNYIGVSSNSNSLKQTEEASTYTHTFSIDDDGNAVITAVFDGSTMSLRYNSASNQNRFRYYKNNGQQAIQLYKKVASYTINAVSNNNSWGTVSGTSTITATPVSGYRVSTSSPYIISPAGSATVFQDGNIFTVTPSANTTVTINFEAIPTHSINTEVSPLGAGSISLGSSTVAEGLTTTATAAANAGYKFTGWLITGTGASLSSTSDNPTTVTMGTADATITAKFDAVTTYAISYSVNGEIIDTKNVEEDVAVDLSAPTSGIPDGYVFKGWVVAANRIDGTTNTDPSANFVTSATATADITYYAVMAVEVVSPETATLTASHTVNTTTYDDHNYTDDQSNTWSGNTNEPYESSVARIGLRSTSGSYLESPVFPGNVTSVKIMTYNGSGSDRTFKIGSTKGGSDLGTVTAPASTKLTAEQTATLTGKSFKKFYLVPSDALGFSYIVVKYNTTSYSNYCTTVPTATIAIAPACTDGEMYYGTYSNSTAFVVPSDLTVSTISVSGSTLTVSKYETGDVVKANTGVMVSAATSGSHTVTLTAETGIELADNMLKPSGDAGITASTMSEADTKFYRLTMHNPDTDNKIGFYWGAENGAAFDLAANKAYLAVPNDAIGGAPMRFWFTDEENNATNIENIESGEETVKFIENGQMLIKKNGIVYDVMGRVVR